MILLNAFQLIFAEIPYHIARPKPHLIAQSSIKSLILLLALIQIIRLVIVISLDSARLISLENCLPHFLQTIKSQSSPL